MIGLRTFVIVMTSTGFPVERFVVEDFAFHGSTPSVGLKLPQVIQAEVNEYSVQLLPDRFQVGAKATKVTQYRIEAVVGAAKYFVDEFTSRRAITAIGHNFAGAIPAAGDDAKAAMARIAWPSDFANLFGTESLPTLSVSTKWESGDGGLTTVRLEPAADDPTKVFYDVNVNWGNPLKHERLPVDELLQRFPKTSEEVGKVIERIAKFVGGGTG